MNNSKNRILDAAERVVLDQGAAHLTLDAVAHQASISKGGLLYNFPGKENLIRGMVARLTERFDAELERRAHEDANVAGRHTRAYVDVCFPAPAALSAQHDAVCAGLLAAVVTNPSLLEPLRDSAIAMQAKLSDDGIDPVVATIVRLAVDGLWMSDLFGVDPMDENMRTQVLDRLRALTTGRL
jgi:AcrR family transcriptional regulator